MLHNLIVPSPLALASVLPSGEKAAEVTDLVWPVRVLSKLPGCDIPELDTAVVLPARHGPAVRREGHGVDELCASVRVLIGGPPSTFHSRTVPSRPPLASVLSSGEKATEQTPDLWPTSVALNSPAAGSHRSTLGPSLALASVTPSGEKATEVT